MSAYRHFQISEREEISCGLAAVETITSITERLRRSRKSVSQEINRNSVQGLYSPPQAQEIYRSRRQKQSVLERDHDLQAFVVEHLQAGWSPEQICGWLKRQSKIVMRCIRGSSAYRYVKYHRD